jgi:hypothetical protein
MRHRRFVRLAAVMIVVLACAGPAIAFAAAHEPMRNHITLGFGYGQHLSDDFDGSDLESGGLGQLAYRYSLNRTIDLCVDARSFMASDEAQLGIGGTFYDVDVSHDTSWFGPGVRWSSGEGGVRPFLQANVYFVQESTTLEIDNVSDKVTNDGAGFGLAGGADIRLSRLLSLPLELSYLYGKPEDLDVSSLGMSVGLTFNFTPLP